MDFALSFSGVTFFFFFRFVTTVCVLLRFFGDVPFSESICAITVFSLYGEYVVSFSIPDGVIYLVTTGWISNTSLCENSIKLIKTIILLYYLPSSKLQIDKAGDKV